MRAVVHNQVRAVILLLIGSLLIGSITSTSASGSLRRNSNFWKGCDEQLLQHALSAIGEKDYERARNELERLARPKCSLASAAMLLIADSHYRSGSSLDLALAEEGYYHWAEMFTDSDLAPLVLRKLAELHLRQLDSRDASRNLFLANRVLQKLQNIETESNGVAPRSEWIVLTEELLADHELKVARFYLEVRSEFRDAGFLSESATAAKGRCEVAIEKYPNYSQIDKVLWYRGQSDEILARTEEETDNLNEAISAYKKIVSEHPDSEFRDRAAERLTYLGVDIPEADREINAAFRERSSKLNVLQADLQALKQASRRGVILDDDDRADEVLLRRALQTVADERVNSSERK